MAIRPRAEHPHGGFTLIELLVVIAIISLLIGLMVPSFAASRKTGRSAVCMVRLGQISLATMNYAGDNRSSIVSFTWKNGQTYSTFPDLNNGDNQVRSHANQAVDIVRRRGKNPLQPKILDQMVDRSFSHLILIDGGYYGDRIPEPAVVCPEDASTLLWQKRWNQMGQLRQSHQAPGVVSSPFLQLLPYASSYQIVPCSFLADRSTEFRTYVQVPTEHQQYRHGQEALPIGGRRMSEVQFPSMKVMYMDLFDRHKYKRPIFYAYPQAAQPLAFFDGSISMKKTSDSNPGWEPNSPDSGNPTTYKYNPGYWGSYEPPTLSGKPTDDVIGYYRWTKGGLKGIDFGGKEQ